MENRKRQEYVNRDYRAMHEAADLKYFTINIRESDLAIGVDKSSCTDSLRLLCHEKLHQIRAHIEDYIKLQPDFRTALVPIPLLPGAPEIVRRMGRAAYLTGVGPMAAVAGVISEMMGEKLLKYCSEVIVENGGDIYLKSNTERNIAVFAGASKFSKKIAIKIKAEETPLGICTSSGTVGPSLSFGCADAVVIKAKNAALADAAATAAANRVKTGDDLIKAVDFVKDIDEITGILAVKEDKMAVWGNIEIVPIMRR